MAFLVFVPRRGGQLLPRVPHVVVALLLVVVILLGGGESGVYGQLPDASSRSSLVYYFTSTSCTENRFLPGSGNGDKENATTTTTTGSNSLSLLRNPNATSCSPSLGVRAGAEAPEDNSLLPARDDDFAVRSESSFLHLVEDVVSRGTNNGIGFEMWFKLTADDDNSNDLQPIVSIGLGNDDGPGGSTDDDDDLNNYNFCDRNRVDMMLARTGKYDLELYYRTSDDVFEPCQRYPIRNALQRSNAYYNSSNSNDEGEQQQHEPQLVHVVISLTDYHQQVHINGNAHPMLSNPFSPVLQHWNTNSKLFLFSYPYDGGGGGLQRQQLLWTSGITTYQLAVHHPGIFNDNASQQVADLLRRGLPHTAPYALNYTIEINEDAELVSGSHYPEWYLHQPHVISPSSSPQSSSVLLKEENGNDDLQKFQLRIGSVDEEVSNFQESLNLTSLMNGTVHHKYVYVLDNPSVGCLYRTDGTPIKVGCGGGGTEAGSSSFSEKMADGGGEEEAEKEMMYAIVDEPATLIYLPPLNKHSSKTDAASVPFTSITYCVSEIPVLHRRQCPSIGVIEIVVQPVNDPPVAMPVTESLTVREGTGIGLGTPKVLLTGTDVDDDDYIQQVQITQPPQRGYLVLSVSEFRFDGLLHGTLLSDLNYNIRTRPSDPVYVKYVWNPASSAAVGGPSQPPTVVVKGKTATDSFRFRVADRSGTWSSEEKVQVVVLSSLKAFVASEQVTIQEDSSRTKAMEMPLKWYGNDTSTYQRDIGYFVETVPPLESGFLLYNESQQQVAPGDLLAYVESFPYTEGLALTFIPSANYCTGSPADSNNNSAGLTLRFRTVSFAPIIISGSQVVTSVSDVREQKLFVDCVIDALTIIGPTSYAYPIKALSLRIASHDPCLASRLHSSHVDEPVNCNAFVARINGNNVTSQDADESEMAQVKIFTGGYLTMNPAFWNRTIPLHGRRILNKHNVSFLASPNDLTNILSDLLYQSFQHGNDTVDIIVAYGDCSAPIDPIHRESKELNTPECQILRHSIAVSVILDTTKEVMPSQLVSGFPWQVVFCMLGYPAIYYAFVRLSDAVKGNDDNEDDDATIDDPDTPVWIQHLSDTGDYYYENTETGEVTWLAPVGELFIPWEEEYDDEESKTEEN